MAPIEYTYFVPMPKLTRKTISEAMQTVPIESLLLGASTRGERQLTAKQRKFAEQIAMGNTKAGAYRAAYNSKGNGYTQSRRGQELTKHSAVQAQIDALRLAAEARKYATPAALRALVIERLTAHAIDDTIQPAQRLRALELLGKITEVAAFTERREIVRTVDAAGAREALLESLRQALRATSIDAEIVEVQAARGNSVTRTEPVTDASVTRDPGAAREGAGAEATGAAPPACASASAGPMLSNPHIPSLPESNQTLSPDSPVSVTREGA